MDIIYNHVLVNFGSRKCDYVVTNLQRSHNKYTFLHFRFLAK